MATESYIAMSAMCAYPPSQHALPNWKCVLRCFYILLRIDITYQESDNHYSNSYPSIRFHIYHLIARCTVHGRRPLDEKKHLRLCFQDPDTVTPANLYTRKELAMMEKYITDFHTSFYIPEIKKLEFQLPHVRILGPNHCGNKRHEAFKRRSAKQDVLCRRDYA